MVSWVDCWCFPTCIHFFQKSVIFRCSGVIFTTPKIEVFQGFQSSTSISTLILRWKMVAPSMRSLSKALNSELSIEPLTKVLAILVPELSQFWRYEFATFSAHESPKRPNLRPSGNHFPCKKWHVPPQKVDSKILFLGALEIPRSLSGWEHDRTFGRTDLIFEITRLYP